MQFGYPGPGWWINRLPGPIGTKSYTTIGAKSLNIKRYKEISGGIFADKRMFHPVFLEHIRAQTNTFRKTFHRPGRPSVTPGSKGSDQGGDRGRRRVVVMDES